MHARNTQRESPLAFVYELRFFVCPPEGGLGSSWLKHALKQRSPTTLIGVVKAKLRFFKHFYPLLPTAMVFVSIGFVLV
jgi:hypothetical protein